MKKLLGATVALFLMYASVFATSYKPLTLEEAKIEGHYHELEVQRMIEFWIGPQECFTHPKVVHGVYVTIYGTAKRGERFPVCVKVIREIKQELVSPDYSIPG